jgi:hypothetical protein
MGTYFGSKVDKCLAFIEGFLSDLVFLGHHSILIWVLRFGVWLGIVDACEMHLTGIFVWEKLRWKPLEESLEHILQKVVFGPIGEGLSVSFLLLVQKVEMKAMEHSRSWHSCTPDVRGKENMMEGG